MYPQKSQVQDKVSSETYPLGEQGELLSDGRAMALVALSHAHLSAARKNFLRAANEVLLTRLAVSISPVTLSFNTQLGNQAFQPSA